MIADGAEGGQLAQAFRYGHQGRIENRAEEDNGGEGDHDGRRDPHGAIELALEGGPLTSDVRGRLKLGHVFDGPQKGLVLRGIPRAEQAGLGDRVGFADETVQPGGVCVDRQSHGAGEGPRNRNPHPAPLPADGGDRQ